eukprot:UN27726
MLQKVLSMKNLAGDLIPLKGVRNRKQWPRNAVREYFNIIERRMNASAAVAPASRQTRTKSGTHTRWLPVPHLSIPKRVFSGFSIHKRSLYYSKQYMNM